MVKVIAFCTVILAAACTADHPADNGASCGDGIVTPGVNGTGEECDDGNTVSGDGCSSTCKKELGTCGDGAIDSGEQCDDGNTVSGDGCSATCKTEPPVCGNGHAETGEQCDDGNTVNGDGCSSTCRIEVPGTTHEISVGWTLKNADDTVVACPNPDDKVAIYSQMVDGTGTNVGQPTIDTFDCNSPGAGITTPLAAGTYNVHVEIETHGGANTYAASLPVQVDISTANKTASTTIYNDAGYISYKWELVKQSDATPLSCSDAGLGLAGGIHVDLTGPTSYEHDFSCSDPMPNPVLLAGSYTVQLTAFNSSNHTSVGQSTTMQATVSAPNQTAALGMIQIPITGF